MDIIFLCKAYLYDDIHFLEDIQAEFKKAKQK
jgi:hypothetical protein